MTKFKYILIFLIFLFSSTSNVLAENKIAYLDIDYILANTNAGKELLKKLKNNEKKKNDSFSTQEQKLKDEENKIIASKSIITEDQLKINISEFQKKLQKYKELKLKEINKLKKTRNDEVINLLNLINPIIEDYMSKNSITIVIDKKNVYIANKDSDITNNLIEIINKKIK